ncbi:MAG: glutathione S-transferase C-terminal domain-containing protein [SAR324 cluster bacterium]|nr:glutathione S-transferase C-terminal domain-containing protein [SAR324 cluster bacterium]
MLVNGQWKEKWHPFQSKDEQGRFIRQTSSIRNWITRDGSPGPTGPGGFKAEPGRYHLFVALICPWASRTLFVRKLKKLDDVLSLSIVSPVLTDQGWQFGGFDKSTQDLLYGSKYLHELYTRHDIKYTGRATVPILWDKKQDCMVNNESSDIIRMLNDAFQNYGDRDIDLYPLPLRSQIEELNQLYYEKLNNGVYRAGFASSQQAYEEAYDDVFSALEDLEFRLKDNLFVLGTQLTETDIRLFVTLIRFDIAYYGLFKCNYKRITDYRNIRAYTKRIYHIPGIRETVNFQHIQQGYYSIKSLNPSGIIPKGPLIDLDSNN